MSGYWLCIRFEDAEQAAGFYIDHRLSAEHRGGIRLIPETEMARVDWVRPPLDIDKETPLP